MTMKNRKTFAAVAAVLLAFCLVFVAPVGAEETCSGCTDNTGHSHVASVTNNSVTKYYTEIQEAIKEAAPAGTVEILGDITVEKWIMFAESLSIGNGNIITLNIDGMTINGNGYTLTVNSIESAGNGNALFFDATKLNINDLTIKYASGIKGGIGLKAGTLNNITIEGSVYGVFPQTGGVIIKDSTFKTTGTSIYFEEERDGLTVTGCTFNQPSDVNVILLRGNVTFTDNIITSGRTVNVVSGSPIVSGNNFGDVRLKVYTDATAKISGNEINNLVFEDDATEVKSKFIGNTLSEEAKTALTSANLKAIYTITVTATSAESGTVSASAETAEEKEVITLTATPNDGYALKEWKVISGEVTIADNKFTMPASNVEIKAIFGEKVEEPVTPPTEVKPSIGATFSEEEKTITPSEGTTAIEFTDEAEIPIDAEKIVGIYAESNPSVIMVVTEATINDGKVSLFDDSIVFAVYPEISSAVDSESEDSDEAVSVVVLIGMDKPDSNSLPSFSGSFNEEIADVVKSVSGKDYQPLSMLSATEKVTEINANLAGENNSIGISFAISDTLYQKYGGKFVALHVKDEKVVDTIQVEATRDEDTGEWNLEFYGDSFSSYVLAVDNTPEPVVSSGSATDTGSGNYQYYPRDVPANGIVDFGTSKVVTGIELPAGSSGKVTLNIKPTFAMPENGYYAFEIDAPGYNLDAKINGGISFQIPVADLEAAGFAAEDIVLYHGTVAEDGTINWEALPTNLVKNENGIAYYKAAINGCSPFYIGFVKDGSVVNTEVVEPVTPPTETPDEPTEVLPPAADEPVDEPTETPAPILAVLAGLGAAVVLRRK